MEKVTSFIAYAVAVLLAWVGKYSAQDIALIVGAVVGVGTFVINWYYRRKSYLLLKNVGIRREVFDEINR
ncbi:HP1 family phage holin [Serratia marcescens]|uniref:HP1 family phage holin n=1 Tax=Serratia marcescens TaxID=615 RepID=UPI0013DA9502|nr:HP1 family phage holin [Serratia marcescens]